MNQIVALCQVEIHVRDLQRSLKFYEDVFGWQPVPAEIHNYVVLKVPDSSAYGISLIPDAKRAPGGDGIVLYFSCEDPDACLERATKAGGRVRFRNQRLPGYGRLDQFEDPDGQRFGLFSS